MKIVPFGAEHIEAAAACSRSAIAGTGRRSRCFRPTSTSALKWRRCGRKALSGVFTDDGFLLGTQLEAIREF